MAFTHTPGVLLSIESFGALLAFHVDCLECGIEKGIIQEVRILHREVYDEDLDTGVHSLSQKRSLGLCVLVPTQIVSSLKLRFLSLEGGFISFLKCSGHEGCSDAVWAGLKNWQH